MNVFFNTGYKNKIPQLSKTYKIKKVIKIYI